MLHMATMDESVPTRIVRRVDLLITLPGHNARDWVHLYHFSRRVLLRDAVILSEEAGIRPVSVEHLEALGQQYPKDVADRYAIVNILTEIKHGDVPCLAYLVSSSPGKVRFMSRDASAEARRGEKPCNDFSPTTWFIGYRPPRD